jgi:hypothetical protein
MTKEEQAKKLLAQLEQERPIKIPVKLASQIMLVTPRYIQWGLQQGSLPFGSAVKMEGRWSYNIVTNRFIAYMRGQAY